jgi:hypothetical protein
MPTGQVVCCWPVLRRYMVRHILACHRSGDAMRKCRQQLRDDFAPLVARAARQWRRAVDRRLQPFGLTEATWLPLIYLARASAPMRQKDLAAALTLDGSSVVRLLDALEASELVERRGETATVGPGSSFRTTADCRSSSRWKPSRASAERPASGLSPTTSKSQPGCWSKSA